MPKRVHFHVSLHQPEGVSVGRIKDYIEEWIVTGKGSYNPLDPMFDLDGDSVVVTTLSGAQPHTKDGKRNK